MLTIEQRVFILECYTRYSSYQECRFRFIRRYPGARLPHRSTIRRIVKKFRSTGSVLDRKSKRRRTVLTFEKLGEIEGILERCPSTSLSRLAAQARVSLSSAQKATKLLKAKSNKLSAVHNLTEPEIMPNTGKATTTSAGSSSDMAQEPVSSVAAPTDSAETQSLVDEAAEDHDEHKDCEAQVAAD